MSAKTNYRKGPIGDVELVDDFLPSPEELALEEEMVKITIILNRSSIDFFKQEADRHHTSYQKMIRRLLDAYAKRYSRSNDSEGASAQ